MDKKNIIVIGASAGGLEVLKQLFSNLGSKIDAAIFIVWHMSADVRGFLPRILRKHSSLPIEHAQDFAPIELNRVYVAPPDRHLLVEKGHVRLTKGPKENRFRPAIDPLFRSAAYAYASRVIGVILSGSLDDGTAGMWTIKCFGGTTVVQDPREAEFPSMPHSALREVPIDYKVSVANMPGLLTQLIDKPAEEKRTEKEELQKTMNEIRVAMLEDQSETGREIGTLTPYACPDCHGVLSQIKEDKIIRYRCHTGHAFSSDALLSILSASVENSIWNAIRGLEETMFLLNGIGDHYGSLNQPKKSGLYFKKAKEIELRCQHLRQALLNNDTLTKEFIEGNEGKLVETN